MNKTMSAKSTFVRDLNVNDEFTIPGDNTVMVCEYRRNGVGTVVHYRIKGGTFQGTFHKPGLSTVQVIQH